MLDPKLLLLDNYLKDSALSKQYRLHEYMSVSPRHLSRLLTKWMEEGYIEYNPLLGKSTFQDIKIHINVETELMIGILNENEQLNSKDLQYLLQLPWSPQYYKAVHTLLNTRLNVQQQVYQYSLMDYVYTIPMAMHPLALNDLVSAQVFSQTLQTLYALDVEGNVRNGIVRYDEWQGNTLQIYLQQEVYFSDGHLLTSEEVVESLNRLMQHPKYESLFTNVIGVEQVSKFKLLIHCAEATDSLKIFLTDIYAGIFKEEDNNIIGTGPYVLEHKTINEIVLRHNMYAKRKPQIHNIYLLKNHEKYLEYDKKVYQFNRLISCPCGLEYMLFNPSKLDLTPDIRRLIAHIAFTKYRELNEHEGLNHQWYENTSDVTSQNEVERVLRVLVDEHTEGLFKHVADALKIYNIKLEQIFLPHEMMLKMDISTLDVDMVWLAETFKREAPYHLIDLLTHCKFKDWHQHEVEIQKFFTTLINGDLEEAIQYSQQYMDEMIGKALLIPAFSLFRTMMVPNEFKNIHIDARGLIDFSKIIVSK